MSKIIITDQQLIDMYDGYLDDMGVIIIGSFEYYPSNVLSQVDPIAYRCGIADYYDSIRDEYTCAYYE
jgi:hypothetical protein